MNTNTIHVTVKFITIMQKYSGNRELLLELPSNPAKAIKSIICKFDIPWENKLEKSTRIFINGTHYESFLKSGKTLKEQDVIAFIPISGGG